MRLRLLLGALLVCTAGLHAQAQEPPHPRFRVVKNRLPFSPVPQLYGKGWPEQPNMGQLCAITPLAAFTYLGVQRFTLQSVADAEQHIYVRTDGDKVVRELLWFQIEEGIPGLSNGYTYATDVTRRFAGIEWKANVQSTRGYTPPPGSDGAAMRAFVAAKGYTLPPMAPRLRLVYLPKVGGMVEFMIIHQTASAAAGADTLFDATVERAKSRFNVQLCP